MGELAKTNTLLAVYHCIAWVRVGGVELWEVERGSGWSSSRRSSEDPGPEKHRVFVNSECNGPRGRSCLHKFKAPLRMFYFQQEQSLGARAELYSEAELMISISKSVSHRILRSWECGTFTRFNKSLLHWPTVKSLLNIHQIHSSPIHFLIHSGYVFKHLWHLYCYLYCTLIVIILIACIVCNNILFSVCEPLHSRFTQN